MEFLKEYGQKYGFSTDSKTWEHPKRFKMRICFTNGRVAEIVSWDYRKDCKAKYSVVAYDYKGYLSDYDILNKMGATKGKFYCNTELEIIIACETIRRLQG